MSKGKKKIENAYTWKMKRVEKFICNSKIELSIYRVV